MNTERVKKRVARLSRLQIKLSETHRGKEQDFTYHGGYSLGYLEGKLAVLNEILDEGVLQNG